MKPRSRSIIGYLALSFFMLLMASKISFAQEKRDVFFILVDTSQSMNQMVKGWNKSKMETVKSSLMDFCRRIPLDSEIWLFTFDKGLQTSLKSIRLVNEDRRQEVLKFIQNIAGTGRDTYAWSSLDDVLAMASRQVKEQDCQVHLFVYTDGKDEQKNGPNLSDVLGKYRGLIEAKAINGSYIAVGFELERPVVNALEGGGFEVLTAFDPELLAPMRASFGWSPQRPTMGAPVQFFDRSLGMIARYEWDFGDGSPRSADKSPSHQFAKAGEYAVTFTVRGLRDRKSSTRQLVTVTEAAKPQAAGSFVPTRATVGQTVVFTDESQGEISGYLWDFGDGSTSDKRHAQHSYEKIGTYTVSLTVFDNEKKPHKVSLAKVLEVVPQAAPAAGFEVGIEHPRAGVDVKFTDTSAGDVKSVVWEFGDGSPTIKVDYSSPNAARSVVHRYNKKGDYQVKLTAIGSGGQTERALSLSVGESQAPEPKFEVHILGERAESKTPADPPKLLVRFEDKSKGNILKRTWDFGDGTAPQEQRTLPSIEHEYGVGTFKVKLTVRGEGNEDYSLEKSFNILGPPTLFERYRWTLLASCACMLGILTFLAMRWREVRRQKALRQFEGTLSWRSEGKSWSDEIITPRCMAYTMSLHESRHGFNGTAVLTKGVKNEFDDSYKYNIVVNRQGSHAESDELDSVGNPSRTMHGLRFKFLES